MSEYVAYGIEFYTPFYLDRKEHRQFKQVT